MINGTNVTPVTEVPKTKIKAKNIKSKINEDLKVLSQEIGVSIKIQHEDFFNLMHRI